MDLALKEMAATVGSIETIALSEEVFDRAGAALGELRPALESLLQERGLSLEDLIAHPLNIPVSR